MTGEDWLLVLTAELGSDSFFATVNPRKSQLEQDFPTFCYRRSHFQLKWLSRNPEQQVLVSRLHRAPGCLCLCSFWLSFSDMPVFNLQKHCLDFTQDFSALHALFNILDKVQVSNSPILAAALALNFRTAFGSPSVWVNTINKVHVCQCWVNILHHCVSVFTQFSLLDWYRFVHDQITAQGGFWSHEGHFSLLDSLWFWFSLVFWLHSAMLLFCFPQYRVKLQVGKSMLKAEMILTLSVLSYFLCDKIIIYERIVKESESFYFFSLLFLGGNLVVTEKTWITYKVLYTQEVPTLLGCPYWLCW